MRFWQILLIIGVLLVAGIAYYGISPLFRNIQVDEALPGATTQESSTPASPEDAEPQAPEAPAGDTPFVGTAGEVTGTLGHPASGTARLVAANGISYVRYENLKTINGPDLYIYLANDLDAKDFVNIGELRATEGNVNYEIPEGVDPSSYKYVLTWCKAFGVLFNYAEIRSDS